MRSPDRLVLKKGTKIVFGQPRRKPRQLLSALRKFFATAPAVEAAYLASIGSAESGTPPHLLIGLKTSGNMQKILSEIWKVLDALPAKDALREGEMLDFLPIHLTHPEGLDRYLVHSTKPFYLKKKPALRKVRRRT